MKAELLDDLLSMVDSSGHGEEMKAEFRRMVEQVGVQNGVAKFKQQQRVNFALKLLRLGNKRPSICERLKAHFDISESQANRDISVALAQP